MTKDGVVKICDFGLARFFTNEDGTIPYSDNKITMCYRPPEILLGFRSYDSKIDIWSAGCILLNLLKQNIIIQGDDPRTVLESILGLFGSRTLLSLCFSLAKPEELEKFRKYPNYSTLFGDDEKTNLIYSGRDIAPGIFRLIPKY